MGKNVWEVNLLDDYNKIMETKIIENSWEFVSKIYYGKNYKIVPIHTNPENPIHPICKIISKKDAEQLTRNGIYDNHYHVIHYINEQIRTICQKGENVLDIKELYLLYPEKIQYFYTSLGFNITISENHLLINW